MSVWQRLRRLFGLSYVARSEPGWDAPIDEHGRTTLSDGTPIQLAPTPNCGCEFCERARQAEEP